MKEMLLKDETKQAELSALAERIEDKKADLLAKDKTLEEVEKAVQKNQAVIQAVSGEYEERIAQLKAKFDSKNELSLDDYTEAQLAKTELKSRIDFFNAAAEELAVKRYNAQEAVYKAKADLTLAIGSYSKIAFHAALAQFMEEHQAELALIRGLAQTSGLLNPIAPEDTRTQSEKLAALFETALKTAENDRTFLDICTMPATHLAQNFTPKRPTQLHIEKYQPKTETGFNRLFNNI